MKNILGATLGAVIDRRDGDSGIKGAILGYLGSGLVKTSMKIGLLAAAGAGIKALVDHSHHRRRKA